VSGSAGAVGLLIGGLLTSYVNWRWCMYVNIAFAAAGIIGGLALLHHVSAPDKPRLSVPSTIIGSAALFGLVFGAAKAQTDGWGAALTVGSLAAGGALLAVFVVVQRYDRSPLIPLRVLADRNRGAAYLVLAVSNAAVFAVFLFLTYYFQGVLHYSPIKTGLAFLPLPLFVATATANYLRGHAASPATAVSATVHGFTTGYWWAAGIYFGGAVILGALIRPRTRLHHDPGKPNPLEEPITAIS
jgi:MFS family permease